MAEIIQMVNNLSEEEVKEDELFFTKMKARAYLKRGGANAWLSQFDQAVDDLGEAMKFKQVFNDVQRGDMEADIADIRRRKDSQETKLQGDICFARNNLDESLKHYTKAIEIDPLNEYALSNIGVIYLKRQNYDECLKYTNTSLQLIEEFHNDTREFNKETNLEVKLLQRRAKCYEQAENWVDAKNDLDKALMYDNQNPAVIASQKKVQEKLNTIQFGEYREEGNKCVKTKEFSKALEFYEKCLRITRKTTTLDNLAIYVNKVACLLALEKFSQVVTECNDATRLIKNYQNKNLKLSEEEKKRIASMQERVDARRSAALTKMGKVA